MAKNGRYWGILLWLFGDFDRFQILSLALSCGNQMTHIESWKYAVIFGMDSVLI